MKKLSKIILIVLLLITFISCNDNSKYNDLNNQINLLKQSQEELEIKLKNISNHDYKDEIDALLLDISNLKNDITIIKDIINEKDVSIEYCKNIIDDLEKEIELLNEKINNIISFDVHEESYKIALNELSSYSKEVGSNNVVDGLVIKVYLQDNYYYYVYYNNDLKEFNLDNDNDDFDVKDCESDVKVDFSYGSYNCDRYFNIPKINGVDKLCDNDGNTLYFYYYYGTSIKNELSGNNGEYVQFSNMSDNCFIYKGLVTSKKNDSAIKNIIFMIPDGAGFGSYDLANFVKQSNVYGIKNALTKTTTDRISGKKINGLYLDEYMVGTSSTCLYNGELTDSGAGGTALSSGYKTNYCAIGVNHEYIPRANILEVCMLEGKATGVVTTKSWIDATPSAFLSHSYYRTEQKDLSYQSLNSNVDILLAYGTSNGSKQTSGAYLHDLDASNKGYNVVNNKYDLYEEVYINKSKKIWSNFTEGSDNAVKGADVSGYHISYDVFGKDDELSLLDMSKSALEVLSNNINDEDGFFLMIEGGAIDNAAHGRMPLESTGEYLAYDETFAYMVNYASQREDTIVISVPDHDTGGYINPNEKTNSLIESILSGKNLDGYTNSSIVGVSNDHTMQNVPLCFYGPKDVREEFLSELGIPLDATASKVRSGNYYDGTVINQEYSVLNSSIANAILKVCDLKSFDEASNELFVNVNDFGSYNVENEVFTFNNGIKIHRNDNNYSNNDKAYSFDYGRGIYVINPLNNNNVFYAPKAFVEKYVI